MGGKEADEANQSVPSTAENGNEQLPWPFDDEDGMFLLPVDEKNDDLAVEVSRNDDDEHVALVAELRVLREPPSVSATPDVIRRRRASVIARRMGSLALCRGACGDALREAGALEGLSTTLSAAVVDDDEELVVTALGALRDLSCGSAATRRWIGASAPTLDALARCVAAPSLRVATSAAGAARNVAHANGAAALGLHARGTTDALLEQLSSSLDDDGRLPPPTAPHREAVFRAASALVNMSEKCDACAARCATSDGIVRALLESWGGPRARQLTTEVARLPSLLHGGLVAVLKKRREWRSSVSNDGGKEKQLDAFVEALFEREAARRTAAQRCEEERKARAKHGTID